MTKNYLTNLLITIVFFLPRIYNAQVFSSQLYPHQIIYEDQTSSQSPEKFKFNYKEMVVVKGKKSKRYVYNYDAQYRLTSYLEEKKAQSAKNKGFLVRYVSDTKKQTEKVSWFKNQKLVKSDSLHFNEYDKLTYYETRDDQRNLKTKDVYLYDSTFIKMRESYSYKKVKPKLRSKQVYEYETDRRLKKITHYNKHNKPYKTTVFDCNPIGVNRTISSDSVYKCVKYDVDSLGNKMEITIENKKNTSSKVIKYFNGNNQLIAQKRYNLKKQWPESFTLYEPKSGMLTTFIYFHKGKEEYKMVTTLDANNNIVETATYAKGKPTSFLKNEFDKEGLIIASRGYDKKQKLTRTVTYSYDFKK